MTNWDKLKELSLDEINAHVVESLDPHTCSRCAFTFDSTACNTYCCETGYILWLMHEAKEGRDD